MNMPNGDSLKKEYNAAWCKSLHDRVEKDFIMVNKRVDKMDARIWGLLVLGFIEVAGIVGILLVIVL